MQNKFLLITRTFWHEPPRARHQLADALSRIGEVVFIENNYWGLSGSKVTIINDKLKLISPSWFLPGIVVMRLPLINELYQLWLNRKILSNYINYTVIVFDPSFQLMHKELLKNSIYYCTDDFINIKRS